jgi:hypothetical protein
MLDCWGAPYGTCLPLSRGYCATRGWPPRVVWYNSAHLVARSIITIWIAAREWWGLRDWNVIKWSSGGAQPWLESGIVRNLEVSPSRLTQDPVASRKGTWVNPLKRGLGSRFKVLL